MQCAWQIIVETSRYSMGDKTNPQKVYRFDTQQFNKCLLYLWVSLKMNTTNYKLWYTWYRFECRKMRGHVTCIEYFWVSLHCMFSGISDKRNTRYNDRSWYIFFSFSEKRKTWGNTCYFFRVFLNRKKNTGDITSWILPATSKYILGYLWKRCVILHAFPEYLEKREARNNINFEVYTRSIRIWTNEDSFMHGL